MKSTVLFVICTCMCLRVSANRSLGMSFKFEGTIGKAAVVMQVNYDFIYGEIFATYSYKDKRNHRTVGLNGRGTAQGLLLCELGGYERGGNKILQRLLLQPAPGGYRGEWSRQTAIIKKTASGNCDTVWSRRNRKTYPVLLKSVYNQE